MVDASALLPAWLPSENFTTEAETLVEDHATGLVKLVAPFILSNEILNALYKAVTGKAGSPPRVGIREAIEQWPSFRELRIEMYDITNIGARILELSFEYKRSSIYNMSYFALAEFLNVQMVTGDRRFLQSLKPKPELLRGIWEYPFS